MTRERRLVAEQALTDRNAKGRLNGLAERLSAPGVSYARPMRFFTPRLK